MPKLFISADQKLKKPGIYYKFYLLILPGFLMLDLLNYSANNPSRIYFINEPTTPFRSVSKGLPKALNFQGPLSRYISPINIDILPS